MLDRSFLKSKLDRFFRPETMPKGSITDACLEWAKAYQQYALAAEAIPTKVGILSPIAAFASTFSESLDSSLRQMWMSTTWLGASATGTTLFVPALSPMLISVGQDLIKSRDPEHALSLITEVLHTYTMGITVTVILANGTSTVVPIM